MKGLRVNDYVSTDPLHQSMIAQCSISFVCSLIKTVHHNMFLPKTSPIT